MLEIEKYANWEMAAKHPHEYGLLRANHNIKESLQILADRYPNKPRLVRRFSAIGPCLTEGRFVKETAKFVVFEEWHGGDRYSGIKRIAKGRVHTEPCRSCRDHAETMYPNGYMD